MIHKYYYYSIILVSKPFTLIISKVRSLDKITCAYDTVPYMAKSIDIMYKDLKRNSKAESEPKFNEEKSGKK